MSVSLMKKSEKGFIANCKEEIEKKFALGNGKGLNERDLKTLSETIESKTGIIISLSTLKRLWKDNFKQSPQIATLNALAMVLDYRSWQDFKLKKGRRKKPLMKVILYRSIYVFLFLVLIVSLVFYWSKKGVIIKGPVHFQAQKTVTQGIPNTVIFNYDVSNVDADSFYIQQSWNDYFRVGIDPKAKAFSCIYYESGFHRAKLFADDSLVAMQPVHIISNGWEPHVYYSSQDAQPIHFRNDKFIDEGKLHLSDELLSKRNVDLSRYFYSRISYSKKFDLSSNNFSFQTRVKVDSLNDKLCSWMQVIIVTEKHIFWISPWQKGCEEKASYKLGEIYRGGKNANLASLGVDPYQWQDIELHIRDKRAQIKINQELAFQEHFQIDFGNIMGLIFLFDGKGSIDYVHLSDSDGITKFEDDFMR